jgi:hypothetical protein
MEADAYLQRELAAPTPSRAQQRSDMWRDAVALVKLWHDTAEADWDGYHTHLAEGRSAIIRNTDLIQLADCLAIMAALGVAKLKEHAGLDAAEFFEDVRRHADSLGD